MSQSSKIRYVPLSSLTTHNELESWLACAIHADGARNLVVIERIPRVVSQQQELLRAGYREIKRAAALDHRGLLSARDLFRRDDGYYIVRNFAPAESLDYIWRSYAAEGRPAPLALTARVIAEAAAALDFVRRQDAEAQSPLVHAHLSPHSLLLGYDGKTRIVGHGTSTIHKALGQARGGLPTSNLEYCAPELFNGAPADARSDIFALGVILWELLTGKRLFARSGPFEVMRAICDEPVTKPSAIASSVPSRLDAIVGRVLAKEPSRRFADYTQFLGALESILQLPGVSDQSMRLVSLLEERFPMRASTWGEVSRAENAGDFKRASTLVTALEQAPAPTPAAPPAHLDEPFLRDDLGADLEADLLGERAAPTAPAQEETVERAVPQALLSLQSEHSHAFEEPTQITGPSPSQSQPAPSIPDAALDLPSPPPADKPQPANFDLDASAAFSAPEPPVVEPALPQQFQTPAPAPSLPEAPSTPPQPDAYFDALDWEFVGDDDDEDEAFEAPFALEEILKPASQVGAAREERAGSNVMELVRHANDRAFAIYTLRGLKRRYRDREAPFSATLGTKAGTIKIRKKLAQSQELRGWIERRNDGNRRRPIDDLSQKIELKPGDQCELQLGEVAWRIRLFRPPLAPPSSQPTLTRQNITLYAVSLGLAILFHLGAMLGVVGIQAAGVQMTVKPDPEQIEAFAEGKLADLKKPTPPEEPKPLPKKLEPTKPTPAPVPDDPAEQEVQIPETIKKALAKRTSTRTNANASDSEKAEDVLNMLKSPNPGSGSSIKDVVSNIDAVQKPGGGDGSFNVSGALDALKGNEVNMAVGGGGKRGKTSGSSALSKNVGKVEKRKSSGKVRGKVSSIKALGKVSGSLTRADVAKTLDRYIGKMQACYESRLTDNPSLSGKVVFSWTVKTDGRVKDVRQRSSTLADAKTTRCLSGVVKSMKFPRPKGGEVEISYPFMFQQR
ncbi:AgmX/PglI C-terminal domain-containing protein [Bradymonas sediminis]|uniref:Uncharacterized protein n=1 Tax=Bradymonas sediminis TaxID=1548548 RepID=A0A2Z4FKY6_9DELT|nr:AgmX/PglI C-terminal domain-containing protein [Bradymonas sediminis]AWV89465.1 hypothetical protein DN745_08980 [Bradymonas sediminis]TDP76809.1 serine/threonine protein kinase [Bradymonas sediminis]